MSDIVEKRLADNLNWAADEITRLRARVEELEGALRHITSVVRAGNAYSPAMVHDFAARALADQEEDANG